MDIKNIFGIYRERSHSPEREFDDSEILRLCAEKLSERLDKRVPLLTPEEFLALSIDFNPELIFFMCEETPCLEKLAKFEANRGCLLINSVQGVENTFRENMLKLLAPKDYFPKSKIISTTTKPNDIGSNDEFWLKRGDYHAIEKEDVLFVKGQRELLEKLERFYQRGINSVILQDHIPGDIIKFYCIKDSYQNRDYWFKWFYHKEQDLKKYPFSKDELYKKCHDAGDSLGLEIYGGDAIVRRDGQIFIIDINAWPSFALFRQKASDAISDLLYNRLVLRKKSGLKLLKQKRMTESFSFSSQS